MLTSSINSIVMWIFFLFLSIFFIIVTVLCVYPHITFFWFSNQSIKSIFDRFIDLLSISFIHPFFSVFCFRFIYSVCMWACVYLCVCFVFVFVLKNSSLFIIDNINDQQIMTWKINSIRLTISLFSFLLIDWIKLYFLVHHQSSSRSSSSSRSCLNSIYHQQQQQHDHVYKIVQCSCFVWKFFHPEFFLLLFCQRKLHYNFIRFDS